MAKDTNTSRCPEEDSVSKFGSTVFVNRYKITNGFRLIFDVQTLGFDLNKDQISSLSSYLKIILRQCLDSLSRHLKDDVSQLEFDF